MCNSKIKFAVMAALLAGTIGTFSAFAHEGEGNGTMSSNGMHGMGGMMNMMSEMSPDDRKAMTEACMKMMQSHGNNDKGGTENEGADAS